MINSFKNPAIMRILRTTERYEAGWREQNFIPDNETHRKLKFKNIKSFLQFGRKMAFNMQNSFYFLSEILRYHKFYHISFWHMQYVCFSALQYIA